VLRDRSLGARGKDPRGLRDMGIREFDDVGSRWFKAMRRGDFEAAWQQTDRIELDRRARLAAGTFSRQAQHLVWDGTPFDSRDVLVRCEHGLGDTIQFIRYVPLLCERAKRVSVRVQPQLLTLLAGCPDFGDVCNGWTAAPPERHDVEIEVMELAYAFRSTLATLPAEVPYLPHAHIAARTAELPRFAGGGALRVGLLWAASEWDTSRSIPIDALEPLGAIRGVRFYSLQQGASAKDRQRAPFPIEPLSNHTADVASAAAAMLELDLVITVDSMAAHLAGALARPVWVLLQHDADWRWMTQRSDSPWYPTMRLFRQRAPGDWRSVARAVGAALADRVRTRA
jgi:hypothetical protein